MCFGVCLFVVVFCLFVCFVLFFFFSVPYLLTDDMECVRDDILSILLFLFVIFHGFGYLHEMK